MRSDRLRFRRWSPSPGRAILFECGNTSFHGVRATAAARTDVQADDPEVEARLLTNAALRLHAERMEQAAAQRRTAEHFTAAHPLVPVVEVPAQAEDVHDLDGLRRIGLAFENGQ